MNPARQCARRVLNYLNRLQRSAPLAEFPMLPPGNREGEQYDCDSQQHHRAQRQRPVHTDQSPNTPTVTPLNAFSPMLAIANKPIRRPREAAAAIAVARLSGPWKKRSGSRLRP